MERLKVPAVWFHMMYQLRSGASQSGAALRFYCDKDPVDARLKRHALIVWSGSRFRRYGSTMMYQLCSGASLIGVVYH